MDLFRVRLNYIDTYQALPTKFDPPLRNNVNLLQVHREPTVPIIRVFGSTETGQKVCSHIHGAFPYLYVEYTGSLEPDEGMLHIEWLARILSKADRGLVGAYIHRFHLSIDYALYVSYRRDLHDGSAKFVARITLVKGVPFYGFHVGYRYFLKIYMLDPVVMTRLADLLRQGVVMKQVFQPFEAHLQYLLQFMVDYNLYGCDYIDCAKVVFRSPVPKYEKLTSLSHIWHDRSIPHGHVSEQSEIPKASHCSIEVDICVQDIINRHDVKPRSLHHDFIEHLNPTAPGEKLVRSMASLWKDEARRRMSRISDLESDNNQSGDIPISMSAGSGRSRPGRWIHEEEYRDRMAALIMDEKSKNGEANISFPSFVKHKSLDSAISTSLESVEDLFPDNLRRTLGLSVETSSMGVDSDTGYDNTVVDEQRILTFNMNDHDQISSDSDEEIPDQFICGKHEDRAADEIANLVDTTEEDNEIASCLQTGGSHPSQQIQSPCDFSNLMGAANSSKQMAGLHPVSEHSLYEARKSGYAWNNSVPSLPHPSLSPLYSQGLESGTKRMEPPETQAGTYQKRQKMLFSQIGSHTAQILEPSSDSGLSHQDKVEISLGSPASSGNENVDVRIATHSHTTDKTSFLVAHPASPSREMPLQNVEIPLDRGKNQPLRFPTVKDCHSPHKAVRVSQKTYSLPGACQKQRAALSAANLSSDTHILPTVASRLPTHTKNTYRNAGGAVLLAFKKPPPSLAVVVSTMQSFGLPDVIHQDAFYSKESDVPDHSREWAGREFTLASSTTPFLPEFDPSGRSEASFGGKPAAALDKHKREERQQYRRRGCHLRSWEVAIHPPSLAEVQRWYCAESRSTSSYGTKSSANLREDANSAEKNRLSQIIGPTQKNKHGFKYTQNQPTDGNARQEAQYMSTMSLEIHVNTRADFVPDPEQDEIQCIFWCFQSASSRNDNVDSEDSHLGVVVISEEGCMAPKIAWHKDIDIHEEPSELDLMVRIVDIVRGHDPDILTGYEVHGSSWGYLIERARVRYDYNLNDELSRMKTQTHRRITKDNNQWGFKHTSSVRVTGRHVINIWRAMRSELDLLQYTMENVAFHLLHRRIPHFPWSDLTRWYANGKPHDIAKVITYYLSRVQLDLEILEKNELIPRTSEQARILGVDFFSVFSRGSQFKVESLMFRIAKPENFLLVSPSRKQIGGQNALECLPLVMEPQSAFYNGPMLVLDFQSLYPSVMIAYNYCYSTCLGRVVNWRGTNKMGFTEYKREQRLLELLNDHINIAPNGIMYTKPEIRKSLLAKMLSEILETRVMVKNGMKVNKSDKVLQRLLNNRQLALKLIANVTYGYTSASFSGRMPCSEIADSIVQTGRETLEKAIALIHSADRWGAEVVYGDTDSLFVYLKGRTKEQAFDIGQEIAETITKMNPHPVKLKFEKVYFPCVLLAKKRYVGFKYDSRDQVEPTFDAKGIETVRRDGTPAEQMIEEKALKILFRTSDLSQVKDYFQKQCEKIMKGSVSIQDFCFAREVKLGTYSGNGPPPPGALISTKRMLLDARAEPQYGERVRYVVVTGAPGARLIDRCVAPEELLHDEHAELDSEYYILKNLIPPLERIFNLVGANVRSWYDEMPKFQRIRRVGNNFQQQGHSKEHGTSKKTLESYMKSSSCLVCGDKVDSDGPMCTACFARKPLSLLSLRTRVSNAERAFMNVEKVCQSCSGLSPIDEVRCDSQDCPVFYTRTKQKARLNTERAIVEPVMEELTNHGDDRSNMEW